MPREAPARVDLDRAADLVADSVEDKAARDSLALEWAHGSPLRSDC